MTTYIELLDQLAHNRTSPDHAAAGATHWPLTIPDDWGQGRTAFGGIIAALIYETVIRDFPDLAPLRSVHFNFVAPASGPLQIANVITRAGKNITTIESRMTSEKGVACIAILSFGHALTAQTRQTYETITPDLKPEAIGLLAAPPHQPAFLQHFDRRSILAPDYLSGAHHPEFLVWIRFNEAEAQHLFSGLLAIADAPPPPALSAARSISALSTMNWTLNLLESDPKTEDGWWLMRTKTEHICDGYSSQIMTIWNSSGTRILDGIQNVVLFE